MEFNKSVIVVIENDIVFFVTGLNVNQAESMFLECCSQYILNFNSYTEFEVFAMLDHGKENIFQYIDGKLVKIGTIRII